MSSRTSVRVDRREMIKPAWWIAGIVVLVVDLCAWYAPMRAAPNASKGVLDMLEPRLAPLLVDYFHTFLQDHDLEAFRVRVWARYSEGTLSRVVAMGDVQARRAAVFALGLVGSFNANSSVAGALKDPDVTVRGLAEQSLWTIWRNADTPENNTELDAIGALIAEQRYEAAIERADRLIARSPRFAEAYNQKAIAEFCLGRFEASIQSCRQVLERNEYHLGALSGMGQCQLRLGRIDQAIAAYRRALKIQPYHDANRDLVERLERMKHE